MDWADLDVSFFRRDYDLFQEYFRTGRHPSIPRIGDNKVPINTVKQKRVYRKKRVILKGQQSVPRFFKKG
jgi:hypothetical protein